jgi:hypothetical protein
MLSAQYCVVCYAETMWEAEDLAFALVEEPLKANDIEPDTFIVEERSHGFSDDEFEFKLKVNMIIPVIAPDYTEAWNDAVEFVEGIKFDDGVELIRTDEVDMVMGNNKAWLRKNA